MRPEIDEHRVYIRDRSRLSAYERALAHLVTPGSIVVDYGAGTGILGMLACRAGAARVYAIEHGGIAGLARDLARANGLAGVLTVVRGNSRGVCLQERADVVVCDQIGSFGFDAGIADAAREAHAKFLRAGGILVPEAIGIAIAAVEHPDAYGAVAAWLETAAGFDVSPAAQIARNAPFPIEIEAPQLVTAEASSVPAVLLSDRIWPVDVHANVAAARDGTIHGIAGWFVAHLSPGVVMTNAPGSAERIQRRPMFFPLREPVDVAAGAAIQLHVRMSSPETIAWTAAIAGRDGTERVFRHSTLDGLLLSKEDVARAAPQHRPALSAMGAARRAVLELCDASHTVEEIESVVYRDHRDLFLSRDEAAGFVAQVLRQDGAV